MNFIGIDLHKKTISACVMNQDRKVLKRQTLPCREPKQIVAFFRQWGEFQAVVEATASYEWLWQLLEPLAQRLVLAHPKKLRVIAESKNKSDKLDAQVLADSLALDMIPRGIPSHAASTTQIVISMSESRNQRLLLTPNILSFQKQSAGEPSERQHWQLLTPSRASEMS